MAGDRLHQKERQRIQEYPAVLDHVDGLTTAPPSLAGILSLGFEVSEVNLDSITSAPTTLERMRLNGEMSRLWASMPGASLGERMRANKRIAEIWALLGGEKTQDGDREALEQGTWGPIFRGYENQPEQAISKLMTEQRGEVPDAFLHDELGPIAFIYGDKTMGPAHIEDKRGIEFVKKIPDVLRNGRFERDPRFPRAYFIDDSDPANVAVIRLDWDGKAKTWLVTLYQDERGKFKKDPEPQEAYREAAFGDSRVPESSGSDISLAPAAPEDKDEPLPEPDQAAPEAPTPTTPTETIRKAPSRGCCKSGPETPGPSGSGQTWGRSILSTAPPSSDWRRLRPSTQRC